MTKKEIPLARPFAVLYLALIGVFTACQPQGSQTHPEPPNIVIIYMDDLGYGDVGVQGGLIQTPNMDRLALEGLRFTNGFASSATCTPSRFALLTGTYPWRNRRARILSGTAPLLIDTAIMTLPELMRGAGYATGIVGKWHLGLGDGQVDWNQRISPGPNEVGFDYAYILAATQDRVPTVYIEDGLVVGLDPEDPILVSYEENFEGEPTGLDNPELLKMRWHHGHNMSIVNGIPRIGFMKGGEEARWIDEDMADIFLQRAQDFVRKNRDQPFFLYYALQQPHVPRTPHPRFVGSSGMGPRGDVIVEADAMVGEFLTTLEEEGLLESTLVIFTSDNGPVLNDGYYDEAVEKIGNHNPNGGLRGGKYSLFEAGTRVPFFTYWKGKIKPGVSDALVCQLDLFSSLAALVGSEERAADSRQMRDVFLGASRVGREDLVMEATTRTAYRKDNWVMIPPYGGQAVWTNVNIETGNSDGWQLYDLQEDPAEQLNLADSLPDKLAEMVRSFEAIRGQEYGAIEELILE